MRSRSKSTTTAASQYFEDKVIEGSHTVLNNPIYVETASHMWDDPSKGNSSFKAVTHARYMAELTSFAVHHGGDVSNAPYPNTTYSNRVDIPGGQHLPSDISSVANKLYYIPVSSNTTDDLGNCVFNAYNQFVNGVQALSSAVSIAELRETPGLFNLWQRRLSAPTNIVNGFLNYSFGWKPLLSDLVAIARELRSFPKTVRKRLKAIGEGEIVRHFKFRLDNTIDDLEGLISEGADSVYDWGKYHRSYHTKQKSRTVVVTIRANVKPKLGSDGQQILDKLGALGAIPSLATLWSVTRLSFVIDWFYNIGGAIENLQGSLTHDISNVRVGVSDLRYRQISIVRETTAGLKTEVCVETQRLYDRFPTTVPKLPALKYPRKLMPYILLSMIGLTNSKVGRDLLSKGPKLNIDLNLDALRNKLKRGDILLGRRPKITNPPDYYQSGQKPRGGWDEGW